MELEMSISGKTNVYGIFGDPIEHSFSPVLQNTIAKLAGINLIYVPFRIKAKALQKSIEGAAAMRVLGLNITVPHKVEVLKYLCGCDEIAKNIGAVNTLKLTDEGYFGYNTDVLGIKESLKKTGVVIKGRTAVIAGAGGAANAAAFYLALEGAQKIIILNRTIEKADSLAKRVMSIYKNTRVEAMAYSQASNIGEHSAFIQTTSLGMTSNESPIKEIEIFKKADVVFDIIYSPWETKLLKDAKKMGANAINGFDMLIYQGIASFEIWNDVSLSSEQKENVLKELKEYYLSLQKEGGK